MRVIVTGSDGFLGRHLCAALERRPDVALLRVNRGTTPAELNAAIAIADAIFHAAGVNRADDPLEFERGNPGFTQKICDIVRRQEVRPLIVYASSVQALRDNPYGRSKLASEEVLRAFASESGSRVVAHRLSNLFGKWARPDYNCVAATFCHHIARDLPIRIDGEGTVIALTHVDDAVTAFLAELNSADAAPGFRIAGELAAHPVSLGELAGLIRSFRAMRETLLLPDLADLFTRRLYSMYLSYLPTDDFACDLHKRSDERGTLAEFIKSPHSGQIFLSRTKPGVTRGNHFHDTKVEKFLVVEGEAVIRFRNLDPLANHDVLEYRVTGDDMRVVDIPPGFAHSIENVGPGELVTLFWAVEVFDPAWPDTFPAAVIRKEEHPSPKP